MLGQKPLPLKSTLSGMHWPAVPKPDATAMLALLWQLEQSQWWSPEVLAAQQRRQLRAVCEHAIATVPQWGQRFAAAGLTAAAAQDANDWRRLPTLARRELQLAGEAALSAAPPKDHGRRTWHTTGGSTGEPLRVQTTALGGLAWRVLTLREHLWHGRDFSAKLASIRYVQQGDASPPHGLLAKNWGSATRDLVETGPCAVLHVNSTTDEQAAWLAEQNPDYLLTYPSLVAGLARHFIEAGTPLARLREVRTFGEILEPETRALCAEAWDVRTVDSYSSEEFGYLALQCPEHEHYHVQSENVLLEVLDDDDQPCAAGEIGRVVVSSLHNFAMPLLRYEIGDYAEVGEACPCGRGLPVLKRIVGRQRNMFTLPDGRRRWPLLDARDLAAVFEELPPILKFQVVQRSLDELEIKLVAARPLTASEEQSVRDYAVRGLGHPFEIQFTYLDDIPRTPRGKYEEFRSEVNPDG